MSLVARIRDVMLTPSSAWPAIAAEETGTVVLYIRYVMPLAAIPAVAGFVGTSLFGVGAFGISVRVPLATGLLQMVVGYAMSLVMIYAMAMLGSALAVGFGGQRNPANALKLIAYSSTAAMIGGVFAVVPALWMMMLVASLYSLYLLLLGAPALMLVPKQKALPYAVVLLVCGIVVAVIINVALSVFAYTTPAGTGSQESGVGPATSAGEVTIDTSNGAVTIDMDRMEAWGKRMEALSQRLEQAQQEGDSAAFEQVLNELNKLQNEQPVGE